MSTRSELLRSIANKIADYRQEEIPTPDVKHVGRWIKQFPNDVHEQILAELNHVFERTYLSKQRIEDFLRGLVYNKKFCGDNARSFWKKANILDIQQGGNSQSDMREMFGSILQEELSLSLDSCSSKDGPYIYLDDGIFNGGRAFQDISSWLQKEPEDYEIRIVVAVLHRGGQYYADRKLKETQKELGIKVKFVWWRILEIENRKFYKDRSDVFWPTETPDTAPMKEYIHYLTEEEPKYKLELRSPGSVGENKLFSSDQSRALLEQQLLLAGIKIQKMCPLLPESERPLGHTGLKTLGFGATIVTYRNCPNTCPLAFWVGDPWYPLFPRKTNRDTAYGRVIDKIIKKRKYRRKK